MKTEARRQEAETGNKMITTSLKIILFSHIALILLLFSVTVNTEVGGHFQCVSGRINSSSLTVGTTSSDVDYSRGESHTTEATETTRSEAVTITQSDNISTNSCQNNSMARVECHEHYRSGCNESGIYTISPHGTNGETFQVYCNMSDLGSSHSGTGCKGPGWTVFQRRVNGSVDFYRNWTSYKKGFGQLNHEFWLGNEILHHLTNQSSFELRVDVVNIQGNPFYSCYENFAIGDETSKYMLTISGWLGGIPDSRLIHLNGTAFSTRDRDNDGEPTKHCADVRQGAWWYNKACWGPNLNGNYSAVIKKKKIHWTDLPNHEKDIQYTELKLRKKDNH